MAVTGIVITAAEWIPVERPQPTHPKPGVKKKQDHSGHLRFQMKRETGQKPSVALRPRPENNARGVSIPVHPEADDVKRFSFQHVKESQTCFYLKGKEWTEFIEFEGAHPGNTSGSCLRPLTWADF